MQGLADVFQILEITFESPAAAELNEKIFESIYYGSVSESISIAKKQGAYPTFQGSPASQGKLQFDLWNYTPKLGGYDWDTVKRDLAQYGMRNSLLLAPMPTASTSQILGNNNTNRRSECDNLGMSGKHLLRSSKCCIGGCAICS